MRQLCNCCRWRLARRGDDMCAVCSREDEVFLQAIAPRQDPAKLDRIAWGLIGTGVLTILAVNGVVWWWTL